MNKRDRERKVNEQIWKEREREREREREKERSLAKSKICTLQKSLSVTDFKFPF